MKLAPLLLLLPLTSCATMLSGASSAVRLRTNPPGATYSTNMGHAGTTPDVVAVPSGRQDLKIAYSLEGYDDAEVVAKAQMSMWVLGNFLWGIPGIVGILVDHASPGSHIHNDPEIVELTVAPAGEAP